MIENLDSKVTDAKIHLTASVLHLTYARDSQRQELSEKMVLAELNTAFAELNKANEIVKDLLGTNTSHKPWEAPNENGEHPGDVCCQRATGKHCYEHNSDNYR